MYTPPLHPLIKRLYIIIFTLGFNIPFSIVCSLVFRYSYDLFSATERDVHMNIILWFWHLPFAYGALSMGLNVLVWLSRQQGRPQWWARLLERFFDWSGLPLFPVDSKTMQYTLLEEKYREQYRKKHQSSLLSPSGSSSGYNSQPTSTASSSEHRASSGNPPNLRFTRRKQYGERLMKPGKVYTPRGKSSSSEGPEAIEDLLDEIQG